jgi:hypothetical protein
LNHSKKEESFYFILTFFVATTPRAKSAQPSPGPITDNVLNLYKILTKFTLENTAAICAIDLPLHDNFICCCGKF